MAIKLLPSVPLAADMSQAEGHEEARIYRGSAGPGLLLVARTSSWPAFSLSWECRPDVAIIDLSSCIHLEQFGRRGACSQWPTNSISSLAMEQFEIFKLSATCKSARASWRSVRDDAKRAKVSIGASLCASLVSSALISFLPSWPCAPSSLAACTDQRRSSVHASDLHAQNGFVPSSSHNVSPRPLNFHKLRARAHTHNKIRTGRNN